MAYIWIKTAVVAIAGELGSVDDFIQHDDTRRDCRDQRIVLENTAKIKVDVVTHYSRSHLISESNVSVAKLSDMIAITSRLR